MGKVVLVTGASSGIGLETAKLLAQNGYTVYAAARRLSLMEELAPYGVHPIALDITDSAQCEEVISKIIAEQGRIDIVFNNAGFGLFGAVEDVPLDKARYQLEVNLFGHARLTQLVSPYMREQHSGKIIMTSSIGGKICTPYGAWYHASKHALEGWSDCLRMELAPFDIKVVIIEPGMINTPFAAVANDAAQQGFDSSSYAKTRHRVTKLTTYAYGKSLGSEPKVIAKTVLKVCNKNKPKARYAKGRGAKLLPALRTFLGDRCFDRLMSRMMQTK